MAFKIYEDIKCQDKFLRLIPTDDGEIQLIVADSTGTRVFGGNILRIDKDGFIHRYWGVSEELGFQLDAIGMVAIA